MSEGREDEELQLVFCRLAETTRLQVEENEKIDVCCLLSFDLTRLRTNQKHRQVFIDACEEVLISVSGKHVYRMRFFSALFSTLYFSQN